MRMMEDLITLALIVVGGAAVMFVCTVPFALWDRRQEKREDERRRYRR